ncbi:hypothetical protein LXA43DRAFT_386584 [Ganoderma leucocontextum]|nr:hypothetical protein LXA43DRAFT_386584 [Ganoderma leucocontextum]
MQHNIHGRASPRTSKMPTPDRGPYPRGPFKVLNAIPPEIYYCIFELLKDDKETLSSCSCVSRHWREVSIPWLFAKVSVLSAERFTGFLEFVDTHSHLGAHIKQLGFHGHSGPSKPPRPHPPISEDSLRTILSSAVSGLPSLRSLSLCELRLASDADRPSTLQPVDLESETQSNRHLRKLSIHCSTLDMSSWTSTLIWFLSRHTMDTLELSRVRIPLLNDSNSSIALSVLDHLRHSVRIPKLVLDVFAFPYHDTYAFLEILLQPGSVQAVSTSCGSSSDVTRIPRFMGVVGQNVRYLSLDVAFFSVESDGPSGPDPNWAELGETLACCPQLESLRIRISAFSIHDYSGLPRHAVFTAIIPYAPRTLHTLTVELAEEPPWHNDMGDFETWDLHALGEYLTREPAEFPSLRSVRIVLMLYLADDNDELAEILLTELSSLKDAGLLRVFCDEM